MREEKRGRLLDPPVKKGSLLDVAGEDQMGVVILSLLLLELSHWRCKTLPSSGSAQLIQLASFFLLNM